MLRIYEYLRLLDTSTYGDHIRVLAGDVIPGVKSTYETFEGRVKNRRSVTEQTELIFLRAVPCDAALKRLRAKGCYPIKIPASEMPNGAEWDNFAEALYTYFIHYCAAEGLTMSHVLARQVLLYLFYGVWEHKKTLRQYPVVRSIHMQATNGRRRFASWARPCFDRL